MKPSPFILYNIILRGCHIEHAKEKRYLYLFGGCKGQGSGARRVTQLEKRACSFYLFIENSEQGNKEPGSRDKRQSHVLQTNTSAWLIVCPTYFGLSGSSCSCMLSAIARAIASSSEISSSSCSSPCASPAARVSGGSDISSSSSCL